MSRPSADVYYNSLCRRFMKCPEVLSFTNGDITVRKLILAIHAGDVAIDDAEVLVALTPEESFWEHIKNVTVTDTELIVRAVAWQLVRESSRCDKELPPFYDSQAQIPFTTEFTEGKVIPQLASDQAKAILIRKEFFGQRKARLKGRLGEFSVPLFVVDGNNACAYLTDIQTTPVPLGYCYTMIVSVAGQNLPETDKNWFRLDLRNPERIAISEDTVFRRLLRKARILP